jgi:FtsP/CotA-like multicopper oxidase with cupredoxin domain
MLAFIALWLSTAAIAAAGTSKFKLELTWGKGAPDGHEREMIFINGQYPGPLLDIQQGDWVEIEVTNWLPFNTTIHYHGMSHSQSMVSRSLSSLRN